MSYLSSLSSLPPYLMKSHLVWFGKFLSLQNLWRILCKNVAAFIILPKIDEQLYVCAEYVLYLYAAQKGGPSWPSDPSLIMHPIPYVLKHRFYVLKHRF